MVYAIQLIDCQAGKRKEYRITGEMYDYIFSVIKSAEGLTSVFETEIGEH